MKHKRAGELPQENPGSGTLPEVGPRDDRWHVRDARLNMTLRHAAESLAAARPFGRAFGDTIAGEHASFLALHRQTCRTLAKLLERVASGEDARIVFKQSVRGRPSQREAYERWAQVYADGRLAKGGSRAKALIAVRDAFPETRSLADATIEKKTRPFVRARLDGAKDSIFADPDERARALALLERNRKRRPRKT